VYSLFVLYHFASLATTHPLAQMSDRLTWVRCLLLLQSAVLRAQNHSIHSMKGAGSHGKDKGDCSEGKDH
jgi:hypothetical protein